MACGEVPAARHRQQCVVGQQGGDAVDVAPLEGVDEAGQESSLATLDRVAQSPTSWLTSRQESS
jgi:hypothetical protein